MFKLTPIIGFFQFHLKFSVNCFYENKKWSGLNWPDRSSYKSDFSLLKNRFIWKSHSASFVANCMVYQLETFLRTPRPLFSSPVAWNTGDSGPGISDVDTHSHYHDVNPIFSFSLCVESELHTYRDIYLTLGYGRSQPHIYHDIYLTLG